MKNCLDTEKSITKKFKKSIWSRFTKAVKEYKLISENDSIAVCISGGKDSILMAKCFQELKKHKQIDFSLKFIVMNPGYNKINLELIQYNTNHLNIPVHIFESNIFEVVDKTNFGSPCYLCARMRRGHLYSKAKELGCNKIALGHHFDDVIETILLNMIYGGEVKTMMPKLHSTNFENMELIRPLYLIKEDDIVKWQNYNGLEFINCACMFMENVTSSEDGGGSKRIEMKKLISQFRKTDPNIENNIFRSMQNINLDAIIGFKKYGEKYSFLDNYDKTDFENF